MDNLFCKYYLTHVLTILSAREFNLEAAEQMLRNVRMLYAMYISSLKTIDMNSFLKKKSVNWRNTVNLDSYMNFKPPPCFEGISGYEILGKSIDDAPGRR